jgi:hypothetical protein
MKRETRTNLWFIVILAILTLPGAVILTMKKLSRTEGRPTYPPAVRREFVFMDPTPGQGHLFRVTPPQLGEFVSDIGKKLLPFDDSIDSLVDNPNFAARMSQRREFQLVAVSKDQSLRKAGLLTWSKHVLPLVDQIRVVGTTAKGEVEGKIFHYKGEIIPIDVVSEMKSYGVILPPTQVVRLLVDFGTDEPITSIRLTYTGERTIADTLELAAPTTLPASPG